MLQTQHRCCGRLRLLRTGVVQRLHRIVNRATHGLFERLRDRTWERRPNHTNDSPTRRAKRPSQRVLLLCERGTLGCGSSRRLVHVAFAIFDSIHWRVRNSADRLGDLAWPEWEKVNTQRIEFPP